MNEHIRISSTSTSVPAILNPRGNRERTARGKHACPNCGSIISERFDFCAHMAFGRVVEEGCRSSYERFYAKYGMGRV